MEDVAEMQAQEVVEEMSRSRNEERALFTDASRIVLTEQDVDKLESAIASMKTMLVALLFTTSAAAVSGAVNVAYGGF